MYSLVLFDKKDVHLHTVVENKEILLEVVLKHLRRIHTLTRWHLTNIENAFADVMLFVDECSVGKGTIGIGHDLYELSVIKFGG